MKKLLLSGLTLILVLIAITVNAQVIKGTVIDSATNKPIAGANIFLNGSYQGTSSSKDGSFLINSGEREIPLIVSCVGYVSQTVSGYANKNITIALKHKENLLREVTIGNNDRITFMRKFLQEFIGTQNYECVITNPGDITFSYHKKTNEFTASAEQPLVIENKKLGYKIKYFLSKFSYSPTGVYYQGSYYFTEDTASLSQKEKKKILWERDFTYYGSRMHLIRSIWANTFRSEGYTISTKTDGPVDYDDLVTGDGDNKYIHMNKFIVVEYKLRWSTLSLKDASLSVQILSDGMCGAGIGWGGDMGAQRVGELLPFEFQPIGRPLISPVASNKPIN